MNEGQMSISSVGGSSGDTVEVQFIKYPWLFFDRSLPDDDTYIEDFIDWRLEKDSRTNTCAVQFTLEILQNITPVGKISVFRILKWFSYETGLFLPENNEEEEDDDPVMTIGVPGQFPNLIIGGGKDEPQLTIGVPSQFPNINIGGTVSIGQLPGFCNGRKC